MSGFIQLGGGLGSSTGTASDSFSTLVVAGQDDLVAGAPEATLTLVVTGALTAATDAGTNTLTLDVPVSTTPVAADIAFTPAGSLAATDVQAALEELDAEKANATHTHTSAALSDATSAGIDLLTAADVPAQVALLGLSGALMAYSYWWRAGDWVSCGIVQAVPGNSSVSVDSLRAYPFIVFAPISVDALGIEVVVTGLGQAWAGIFADTGSRYPGALVAGTGVGPLTVATLGARTGVFTAPVTLQPGLYWLTFVVSAACQLRAIAQASIPNILGAPLGGTAAGYTVYSATYTAGSMPSTFPAGAVLGTPNAPVFARIA